MALNKFLSAARSNPNLDGDVCLFDQGTLNYLYHTGKLVNTTVYLQPYAMGVVNTLHYGNITTDKDGFVTNKDGSKSCVVHQYDRHPELVKRVDQMVKTTISNRQQIFGLGWDTM